MLPVPVVHATESTPQIAEIAINGLRLAFARDYGLAAIWCSCSPWAVEHHPPPTLSLCLAVAVDVRNPLVAPDRLSLARAAGLGGYRPTAAALRQHVLELGYDCMIVGRKNPIVAALNEGAVRVVVDSLNRPVSNYPGWSRTSIGDLATTLGLT